MALYSIYDKDGKKIDLSIDDVVIRAYENTIVIDNEVKEIISRYEKRIPLYDILTKKIYLVYGDNVYERVVRNHYRLLDNPDNELYKKNEHIMKNYNLDKLKTIYYKLFYLSQPQTITHCQRPSFSPIMSHITPYYTKHELIQLGLNLKLISIKDVEQFDGKKICDIIKNNDISYETLVENQDYIFKEKVIGLVKNYSLHGSFYMNNYLRNIKMRNFNIEKQIIELTKIIRDAPTLKNDFSLFRFIKDDFFLSHLKIGDTYIDDGFMSCTRNPFYYESSKTYVFGFILLKINIKKDKDHVLFIESYSNFPYEQEAIFSPWSKLRLDSINDSFEYYSFDKEFQKKMTRKYEFTYLGTDKSAEESFYNKAKKKKVPELKIIDLFNDNFEVLDLTTANSDEEYLVNRLDTFIKLYSNENYQFKIKLGNKEYIFQIESYDATGLYAPFFYYKVKNGIMFYLVGDKGNINLLLEIGDEIHVNYYFKNSVSEKMDPEFIKWISMLAYHLQISSVIIHPDYYSSRNNSGTNKFYQQITYQGNIYDYLKDKKKYFENISEINQHFNYFKLDSFRKTNAEEILREHDHDELYLLYMNNKNKIKSVADLYLFLVDYQPFYLSVFLNKIKRICNDLDNPFLDPYYQLNVGHYLYNNGIIKLLPEIKTDYNEDEIKTVQRDTLLSKIKIPRIFSRQRLFSIAN